MSYSFGAKGSNKTEVLADVAKKLGDVVVAQPVHSEDIGIAQATADAVVGKMQDDDTRDIVLSMSGSIWKSDDGVQSCSVNVSAYFANRTPA